MPVADRRLAGWAEALRSAGIEPEDTRVEHASFTRDGRQQAMATLIERAGCTAVFASGEVQAIGALPHARSAGRRGPEDLSVVSFDGTELARHAVPRLTAVVQPLRRIAELAAAEVVRRIADPAAEPRSIEVPTSLEPGDSTAPPRG